MPTSNPAVLVLPKRPVGLVSYYTDTVGFLNGWFEDPFRRWVYLSLNNRRTIGSGGSGASIAADWLWLLYQHIWLNYDTQVINATGTLVSKNPDPSFGWTNHQRITLPDYRGRVLLIAGTGGSLSNRAKGSLLGAETHTLSGAEMPVHNHTAVYVGGTAVTGSTTLNPATSRGTASPGPGTNNAGGGQPHNNMQPSAVEHLIVSTGV